MPTNLRLCHTCPPDERLAMHDLGQVLVCERCDLIEPDLDETGADVGGGE